LHATHTCTHTDRQTQIYYVYDGVTSMCMRVAKWRSLGGQWSMVRITGDFIASQTNDDNVLVTLLTDRLTT